MAIWTQRNSKFGRSACRSLYSVDVAFVAIDSAHPGVLSELCSPVVEIDSALAARVELATRSLRSNDRYTVAVDIFQR